MLSIEDEKYFYSLPEYTREEVRDNECSNWIIINDLVFDLTEFLHIHPGGQEVLYEYMGLDATSVFEDVGHGPVARTIMLRYVIGRLAQPGALKSCRNSFSVVQQQQQKRRRSSAAATAAAAAIVAAMSASSGVVSAAAAVATTGKCVVE